MKFSLIALVTVICVGVIATSITLQTYVNSLSETAKILWQKNAESASQLAKMQALKNIETASMLLETSQRAVKLNRLNIHDKEEMMDWLLLQAMHNPGIATLGFAYANEELITTGRSASGAFFSDYNQLLPESTRYVDGHLTERYEHHYDEKFQRRSTGIKSDKMIPSTRPWFKKAIQSERLSLVDPYLVDPATRIGTTLSLPHYSEGGLDGVWLADVTFTQLSIFLSKLSMAPEAKVFLLTDTGDLVGYPSGVVSKPSTGGPEVIKAFDHPNLALRMAWKEGRLKRLKGLVNFEFGEWLGMAEKFKVVEGTDWIVLTMVPRASVIGAADHLVEKIIGAFIAVGLVILAFGIAILRRVKNLSTHPTHQLESIGFSQGHEALDTHRKQRSNR